ncbi:hypothetical protein Tco_0468712 [Tanacetum coccineum]
MLHQPHHHIFHPTIRIPIRQENLKFQLSSSPHTNVADKAASTGVDVRHGGAATTVTSLDAGQGSGITLVQINAENQVTHTKVRAQGEAHTQQDQPKDHLRVLSAAKVLADAARKRREVVNVQSYTRRRRAVSIGSGEISIAEESISTAGASILVSTAAERQRMAQVHQAAQGFTDAEWDDVLARVTADKDFF